MKFTMVMLCVGPEVDCPSRVQPPPKWAVQQSDSPPPGSRSRSWYFPVRYRIHPTRSDSRFGRGCTRNSGGMYPRNPEREDVEQQSLVGGGSLHSPLHISHSLPAGTGTPHLHTHRPCNHLRRSSNPLPGNCHRFRLRTRRNRHHNPADRIRMSRLHHRLRLHRRWACPAIRFTGTAGFVRCCAHIIPAYDTLSAIPWTGLSQVSSPLQKKSPHSGGQTGQSAGQLWQVSSGSQVPSPTLRAGAAVCSAVRAVFIPAARPVPAHPIRAGAAILVTGLARLRTRVHCRPRTQRCSPRSLRDSCSRPPYRCMSHLHTAERTGNHWGRFRRFHLRCRRSLRRKARTWDNHRAVLTILIGIAGSISTERRTISAIGRTALAVLDAFIAHTVSTAGTTIGFACSARFTEVTLPVAAAISTISGACFAGFGRITGPVPAAHSQSCSQEKQLSLASHVPLPQHEPQSSAQLAQSSPVAGTVTTAVSAVVRAGVTRLTRFALAIATGRSARSAIGGTTNTSFSIPAGAISAHLRTHPAVHLACGAGFIHLHVPLPHTGGQIPQCPGTWSMFRLPAFRITTHVRTSSTIPDAGFTGLIPRALSESHRHRGILRSPPRTIRRFPLPRTGRHHTLEGGPTVRRTGIASLALVAHRISAHNRTRSTVCGTG